ncbi:hypothetical protein PYCCODRAFT_1258555 [Trametes coccinea BRFM310]|uniref:Uncharacterized protein n=1 Tax=Trametes coccinea (strain BRFM310) TaxID=1353009 RepID=A0A1Y2I696_TRAC3|nr:hypothetical protein PYCCODRAFT_1258555 [Trametes coccinea BRFM310]
MHSSARGKGSYAEDQRGPRCQREIHEGHREQDTYYMISRASFKLSRSCAIAADILLIAMSWWYAAQCSTLRDFRKFGMLSGPGLLSSRGESGSTAVRPLLQ